MESRLLKIQGVCKSFGNNIVLNDIHLNVSKGEVISIIGPSGSGKTTLLRCINMLTEYDKGSIQIENNEIGYTSNDETKRKKRSDKQLSVIRSEIGMVFQLFYLFPHLTALENVMLGLQKVRKHPKVEAQEIACRWLERVGLSDKLSSLPSQLSGGQQQRVGIARAVAMEPKLLLLDEITSALDPELIQEVLDAVQQLAEDGMTMILVTHEMLFAKEVSDRIIFMDKGIIVSDKNPHETFHSKDNARLNEFLSRIKKEDF
jgi:polar amino acid transport system ATP-binding protein